MAILPDESLALSDRSAPAFTRPTYQRLPGAPRGGDHHHRTAGHRRPPPNRRIARAWPSYRRASPEARRPVMWPACALTRHVVSLLPRGGPDRPGGRRHGGRAPRPPRPRQGAAPRPGSPPACAHGPAARPRIGGARRAHPLPLRQSPPGPAGPGRPLPLRGGRSRRTAPASHPTTRARTGSAASSCCDADSAARCTRCGAGSSGPTGTRPPAAASYRRCRRGSAGPIG